MSKKKILIVDDDPAALVNVTHLVEKAGYQAVGFQKPELAMAYLERPESRDVRMVIADMVFRTMDGFTFLKEVKKKDHVRLMPFLFLSELNDTAVLIHAYEHGAVDYFIKPIQKENLFIAKIRSMADAFERTLISAHTVLAGHLEEKPLAEILAVCEHESLNGFLKIVHPEGFTGVMTFEKGLPESMAVVDASHKPVVSETEAFEMMGRWTAGEFIVRRGKP